jgi:hypothetical protein
MSTPTQPVIPTGAPLTLAVDPSLLKAAGRPLHVVAADLRSASEGLRSAWDAAARALAAQRTGQVLASCQAGAFASLAGCAEALNAFGNALQRAGELYQAADATAVPASGTHP